MLHVFFTAARHRLVASLRVVAVLVSVAGVAVSADLLDQIDTDPWRAAVESVVAKAVVVLEQHDIGEVAIAEVRAPDGLPRPAVAPGLRRRLRDGLRALGKLDDHAATKLEVTVAPATEQTQQSAVPDATQAESKPAGPSSIIGVSLAVSLTPAAGKQPGDLDGAYLVPQADQDQADETTVLGKDGVRKQPFVVERGRFIETVPRPELALVAWGGSGVATGDTDGYDSWKLSEKNLNQPPLIVLQGRAISMEGTLASLTLGDAEGRPLPVDVVAGVPMVTLGEDAPFTVILGNGDRSPIGAVVIVDGLESRYFARPSDSGPRSVVLIGVPHPLSPRVAVVRGWTDPGGGPRSFGGLDDDTRADRGAVTVLVTETKPEAFYRRHFFRSVQTRRVPREGGGTADIEALVGMANPIGIEESWSAGAIARAVADGPERRIANQQVRAVLTIGYRRSGTVNGGPP